MKTHQQVWLSSTSTYCSVLQSQTTAADCHDVSKTEWITARIVKSIKRRDTLYRNLKHTPTNSLDYEQKEKYLRTLNVIPKKKYFHSEEHLLLVSLH